MYLIIKNLNNTKDYQSMKKHHISYFNLSFKLARDLILTNYVKIFNYWN